MKAKVFIEKIIVGLKIYQTVLYPMAKIKLRGRLIIVWVMFGRMV